MSAVSSATAWRDGRATICGGHCRISNGGRWWPCWPSRLSSLPLTAQRVSTFLSSANLRNVVGSQAVIGVLALASLPPLIAREFDLSVGSVCVLASIVIGKSMADESLPLSVSIGVGVASRCWDRAHEWVAGGLSAGQRPDRDARSRDRDRGCGPGDDFRQQHRQRHLARSRVVRIEPVVGDPANRVRVGRCCGGDRVPLGPDAVRAVPSFCGFEPSLDEARRREPRTHECSGAPSSRGRWPAWPVRC